MKKVLLVLIAVVVLAVMAACSSPAPTSQPTATTQPTTQPTSTSQPTSTAQPVQSVELELYSAAFGGLNYISGVTLAELLNKNSSWIKATNLETSGSVENTKRDDGDAARKAITLRAGVNMPFWMAQQGTAPLYTKKYTDMKAMFTFAVPLAGLFVSSDPNIKGPADLKGKRIGVGSQGSAFLSETQFILRDCWGIWDDIKPEYLDFNASRDAFMDGLLDVIYTSGQWLGGDTFAVHPLLQESLQLKQLYFIGPTQSEIDKGKAVQGWPVSAITVPTNAFDGKAPQSDILAIPGQLFWWCYPEVPEDVVYEVVKTAYENIPAFHAAHNNMKVMSPEVMAFLPVASEDDIHPGALKFYKENNIKISVGGASPLMD